MLKGESFFMYRKMFQMLKGESFFMYRKMFQMLEVGLFVFVPVNVPDVRG